MDDMLDKLTNYLGDNLPRLLAAIGILVVGWIVAYLVASLVKAILKKTNLDNRILKWVSGDGPQPKINIEKNISQIVFYVLLLFVLVAFFQTLRLYSITDPLNNLLTNILNLLPNIIGAAALVFAAWVIARLVKFTIRNVLQTFNLDEKLKPAAVKEAEESKDKTYDNTKTVSLTSSIANIGYWLVFLFFIPIILDVLNLNGLLDPIKNMIDEILGSVPNLFAAVVLLTVAYFVARVISDLISSVLSGIGFDSVLSKLGFTKTQATLDSKTTKPSTVVGKLVMVYILLFAAVEAMSLLNFVNLTALLTTFIALTGNIVLGLVIFAIGLFLANIAATAIKDTGMNFSAPLSMVARGAIIILAGGMALDQMGVGDDIVNMAFGLTLGALAVAFALAFGLGGRDAAGRLWEDGINSIKGSKSGGDKGKVV